MNLKKIDPMWDDDPVNVTTEVNFIWSIANRLRGAYQSDKYKDVVIPMTIIRRLECALEATKEEVLKIYNANPEIPSKLLQRASNFSFYNTSELSLTELLNDPNNIAANFKAYIEGFSDNVQEIFRKLDFNKQIDKMEANDRLFSVVQGFASLDLNPQYVDNVKMGYIFEDLIRRFSENTEAGDHYTGRDIIKTMVSILLAEGCDDIFQDCKVITILDQACGTGGMLSTSYNYIRRFNPTADIRLFGQDVNDESFAICVAEMLIKGQSAENIRKQDTFKGDAFPEHKMRFVLENPPFGTPWGGKDAPEGAEAAVRAEHAKGFAGRWGAGLPGSGDAQLLFLQSAVNKMDDQVGRAAIIENGSPLFTGGTASGESQIRRWLLEQDLIEAIIALPTDMFYNTGIATYIWVLSKNKREERRGKVQLINATGLYKKLRKALGNKRNEISPENRKAITELYANFEENEFCKIFPNEEFMYREYTVMQPLQRSYGITEERIENMINSGSLSSFYDEAKHWEYLNSSEELSSKDKKKLEALETNKPKFNTIVETLRQNVSDEIYNNPQSFEPVLRKVLASCEIDKKLLVKIADGLSVMDKNADIQTDKKGHALYDKATADTEIVKFEESIDEYMAREVLPHVPDAKAFWEEKVDAKKPVIKTGAEIPFTRYFYKYQQPEKSEVLAQRFVELEASVTVRIANLFNLEKQIETLQEYKKSVITEAVTKGLDPNVEMKDSGVEWIGTIPAYWEVHRIKTNFDIIGGNGFSLSLQGQETGDLPVCKASDISNAGAKLSKAENFITFSEARLYSFNLIPKGSVLFAKIGEAMKKNNRTLTLVECCADNNCQAMVPKKIDSQFSYYLFNCIDMTWFDNAGTVPCISNQKLKNSKIPYPWIFEQKRIAKYLNNKCTEIDSIIEEKQKQLEVLEQYKQSLIYEYVTGKKAVPT